MQSILEPVIYEFIEKKSRFIGLLFPIENLVSFEDILSSIKNQYPGATHYVYAYIINHHQQKAHDDGEPLRTAGYPVLDVLLKNNLNDVLAIVIRYYGGINLGAGGLIRAYTHSISETIKKATFSRKVTQYDCLIQTNYQCLTDINRILQEYTEIKKVDYGENIVFEFLVLEEKFELVKKQLFNANQYQEKLKVLQKNMIYTKVPDLDIQIKI